VSGSSLWLVLIAIAVVACGPERQPSAPGAQSLVPSPQSSPKRITIAILSDPPVLSAKLATGAGSWQGLGEITSLVNVGMITPDDRGNLVPVIAEQVPTTENGLWQIFPDGRMETRYTIRAGFTWHDGTPFTADDIPFTARIEQDRELAVAPQAAYRSVEEIRALDSTTVSVTWRQPFILANTMFAAPLPRHLLERAYTEDKPSLAQLPYWAEDFIGTGPYKLQTFVRGSHFTLVTNETFAPGRPKTDEITVKFIADPRTLVANVLAGGVDLTLGRGLSIDQSLEIRDRWTEGTIAVPAQSWLAAYPQFINPNPVVVGNAQFRRALAHGTDRQQLADAIQAGLVPVAHSLLNPESADYPAIQSTIVRYDFDARRAAQLIEALGFSKGSDGMFLDQSGQKLSVEIRAVPTDTATKTTLALADSWQRLGVGAEPNLMPPQLQRDLEYRANAPGFTILRNGASLSNLVRFHSNESPLPQNGFVGENKARYINPEFDAMIDRYFVTIPLQERYQVAGQIIHHMTDIVLPLGLFYDSEPSMVGNRVRNFTPSKGEGASSTWNSHEWDVR